MPTPPLHLRLDLNLDDAETPHQSPRTAISLPSTSSPVTDTSSRCGHSIKCEVPKFPADTDCRQWCEPQGEEWQHGAYQWIPQAPPWPAVPALKLAALVDIAEKQQASTFRCTVRTNPSLGVKLCLCNGELIVLQVLEGSSVAAWNKQCRTEKDLQKESKIVMPGDQIVSVNDSRSASSMLAEIKKQNCFLKLQVLRSRRSNVASLMATVQSWIV